MILTGETEVLGEKQYTAWVVDGWMRMEQWWNDTDRETEVLGEEILSQCHLFTTDLTLGLTSEGTRTYMGKTNCSLNYI